MFPKSMLEAHEPRLRKKNSAYRALDLKINHLAHYRENPRITDPSERGRLLRELKIERQRLDNEISAMKRKIEQEIIIQHQWGRR